jgi:hypothetical protein
VGLRRIRKNRIAIVGKFQYFAVYLRRIMHNSYFFINLKNFGTGGEHCNCERVE